MWFMGSGIATRIDLNEAVAVLADRHLWCRRGGRRQMGATGKDDG